MITALRIVGAVIAVIVFSSVDASAQTITVDMGSETGLSSRIIQLVLLTTILSLAPSILIMMTSFVRIVIVLSLLRTAIGIQQSPPNPVIISLALFLTAFIMAPTFSEAYVAGVKPIKKLERTVNKIINVVFTFGVVCCAGGKARRMKRER